jgi:hypothetical protein
MRQSCGDSNSYRHECLFHSACLQLSGVGIHACTSNIAAFACDGSNFHGSIVSRRLMNNCATKYTGSRVFMSTHPLFMERTTPEPALFAYPAIVREVPHPGPYQELIRRHFPSHSAVAIVGGGDVCENIAAELAASGNRVLIVSVHALLHMNPIAMPEESGCTPARTPNVWLWPSAAGGKFELSWYRGPADAAGKWLDSLRLTFDAVLLDCPATETAPGAAQLAAMADAAILVVEAGLTTRRQIQHDQRALQSMGVKLAGCILMHRK